MAVLGFPARDVEVVPQSEVEGEAAGDLPVILEIEAPVRRTGEGLRVDVETVAAGAGQPSSMEARPLPSLPGQVKTILARAPA